MDFPNFTDPQFVDSAGIGGLNAAFSTVSGSVANAGSGLWAAPGLIAPESATISFSGLVATIGLAQPFGIVTVSGSLAHAHGTLTGQSTTTYSPDFSSLVPATGSVTAYAIATVQQIQQNPFPIPGPPPGHPSFNPSFVPTVGYASNQQTLAVSATTTAADNVSTFELLRTTLTAGQASVTSWSTAGQKRAPLREAYPPLQLAAGGAIGAASACYTLMPSATGLTTTLPPTSGAAGIAFRLVNPLSGNWTIAAAGSDTIVAPGGAASSTTIPPSGSALVWADPVHGQWDMLGAQIFGALNATQTWNGVNTFQGTGSDVQVVTLSDTTNANGAALKITGNGATTPSKFIRMLNGVLQFVNNAYTAIIGSLDDSGNFTAAGTVSCAKASSSGQAVTYDQFATPFGASNGTVGTSLSATTGAFTAPSNGNLFIISTYTSKTLQNIVTATTTASLSGLSQITQTFNGINDGNTFYLPMSAGQSTTLTISMTVSASDTLSVGVSAIFFPGG